MKRPAFQFYPADWRKDTALQFCSLSAQGLWINALCIAHECEPYGHLVLNGRPMTSAQIGRLVGLNAKECDKLLAELVDAGVCSKTDEGAFFSRRMVRDEDLRNRRAAGGQSGAEHGTKGASHGSKGGRPKTEQGGIENPPSSDTRGDKEPPLKPPPSSSSSSSTSVRESAKGSRLTPGWAPAPEHMAFAESLGLANGRAVAELEKFRDYWAAQPGQKGVKTDWPATWRNWVRRAVESTGKPGAAPAGGIFDGAH